MEPDSKLQLPKHGRSNGFVHFFRMLGDKINDLFRPEEVEVTFKNDGKNMSYTYTKVTHKQVA